MRTMEQIVADMKILNAQEKKNEKKEEEVPKGMENWKPYRELSEKEFDNIYNEGSEGYNPCR